MTSTNCVRSLCAVIAASFVLIIAGPARAQTQPSPAALGMAKELVEILGTAREFEPLVTGVIVQTASSFLQANPALSKDLNEVVDILVTENLPRKNEVPNEVVRLYASRLTDQELKDLLTFYKSPLGKKMLVESSFVMGETIKKADAWAAKFREEITARIRAELKKKGHNL